MTTMTEMETSVEGANIAAEAGQAVWFTQNRMTIKATSAMTGGAFGLVEAVGPAGSSPPLHVHHREDEAFWVLEGTLTVRCGDRTFTAGPGSFTFLPRGVPHTFVVEGDAPVRLLSICVPGGFEEYFVAAGRPAGDDGLPPNVPPDVAMLREVGERYGLEIVGPPLAPRGTLPRGKGTPL
jgi:mannose-6-phosphate isomerase-like protein (cupin superfamily)